VGGQNTFSPSESCKDPLPEVVFFTRKEKKNFPNPKISSERAKGTRILHETTLSFSKIQSKKRRMVCQNRKFGEFRADFGGVPSGGGRSLYKTGPGVKLILRAPNICWRSPKGG